ncbi:MAG TPA: group II intron maturase-specific domain-containing protein, partial [Pirellulales bacterium]|nr:group II intron maturase-specific domain-containing protein [Pirellulales bacterium]
LRLVHVQKMAGEQLLKQLLVSRLVVLSHRRFESVQIGLLDWQIEEKVNEFPRRFKAEPMSHVEIHGKTLQAMKILGDAGMPARHVHASARPALVDLRLGFNHAKLDSVLSRDKVERPFMSNIVLDVFDWELQRRGLRFVRYADDCNIFVRSQRAGQRVMASVRRFIEQRLRLLVNEEKSKVARPAEVHFLGFRLCERRDGQVEVHISARTKERLDTRIRELTPRTWGQAFAECIAGLNRYLSGWFGYFRICTEEGAKLFWRFDAHIRRRLRAIIVFSRAWQLLSSRARWAS